MLYAIISEDIDNSLPLRLKARPAHIARLQTMLNEGQLILAGPHPTIDNPEPGAQGFTGSLIVAEFSSLSDAESWANADPYMKAGVYSKVTIKPFKQVLP